MTLPVRLDHRAVISIAGPDAESFLNGLLTQSSLSFVSGERRYGALLTPQGKVIADLLLAQGPAGFLADVAADAADALVRRLSLFRLRAAVAIERRSDLAVFAFAGSPDPRSAEAPARAITARERAASTEVERYHAARIAAGLAEQGVDFASEEVFPADINMDLLNGVDFRKGCFVGQEVVSRMKRRGTARRRTLVVELPDGAPALPAILSAGDVELGVVTSVAGGLGLSRMRIDRLASTQAAGQAVTAGDLAVTVREPSWLAGEIAALRASKGETTSRP